MASGNRAVIAARVRRADPRLASRSQTLHHPSRALDASHRGATPSKGRLALVAVSVARCPAVADTRRTIRGSSCGGLRDRGCRIECFVSPIPWLLGCTAPPRSVAGGIRVPRALTILAWRRRAREEFIRRTRREANPVYDIRITEPAGSFLCGPGTIAIAGDSPILIRMQDFTGFRGPARVCRFGEDGRTPRSRLRVPAFQS
jgi:hypothetical protein